MWDSTFKIPYPLGFFHVFAFYPNVNVWLDSVYIYFTWKAIHPQMCPQYLPHYSLTIQLIKYMYYNDRFPYATATWSYTKDDVLIPHLQNLGRNTPPPPFIITTSMYGTIHQPSINLLLDLDISHKNPKPLMDRVSLNTIVYLTYIVLNKHNITQWCGPSKYNNGMLRVQLEYESPYATFRTSNCYILRAHKTRVARWVMLWT